MSVQHLVAIHLRHEKTSTAACISYAVLPAGAAPVPPVTTPAVFSRPHTDRAIEPPGTVGVIQHNFLNPTTEGLSSELKHSPTACMNRAEVEAVIAAGQVLSLHMQAALEVLHHALQAILELHLGLPTILVAHLGDVWTAARGVVCRVLLVGDLCLGVDHLLDELDSDQEACIHDSVTKHSCGLGLCWGTLQVLVGTFSRLQ